MANLDSLQLLWITKNLNINTNRLEDDQIKDKIIKIQHVNIKLAKSKINPNLPWSNLNTTMINIKITLISYENNMIKDHKHQNKNQN